MQIKGRIINQYEPPYIIAEMSANHNGSIENAYRIIDMAISCGADAVKLQTYRPDTITMDLKTPEFMIKGGLWDGQSLFELYESAFMPWDWHKPLFEYVIPVDTENSIKTNNIGFIGFNRTYNFIENSDAKFKSSFF